MNDADTVREISQQVRTAMTETLQEMLQRRKSVFYGSILTKEDNLETTDHS